MENKRKKLKLHLPWRPELCEADGRHTYVVDQEYVLVAYTYPPTAQAIGMPEEDEVEAYAELICTAVNNHDALVEVLKEFISDIEAVGEAGRKEWPDLYITAQHAADVLNEIRNPR